MAFTWILTEIETEVRALTGKPGTVDLDQPAMFNWINEFYQNWFPDDVYAQEWESWWTFNTADSDTGSDEDLPVTVRTIEEPMTIKDSDDNVTTLRFYTNKSSFYRTYPEDSSDEEDERGTPAAILLYNRTVSLRPKADAVFEFKSASKIRPTALTADTAPLRLNWGLAIAQGTAVLLNNRDKDYESALEKDTVYQGMIDKINGSDLTQKHKAKRAMPRY